MIAKAISYLKQNPDILEKFLRGETSLVGLNQKENQAVKFAFSGNAATASVGPEWYWS